MTNKQKQEQYRRNTCYFCGHSDSAALEEHHIQPKRHGGSYNVENLVLVCANCHRKLESLYDKSFYAGLGVDVDKNDEEIDDKIGTTKEQAERMAAISSIVESIESVREKGAPIDEVIDQAANDGIEQDLAKHAIGKLKEAGEVYEPRSDCLRCT